MKAKKIVLSLAPFLVMFAITIGAGRYSSMVTSIEGHGAKGAYGYDVVIILALALVVSAIGIAVVYGAFLSNKKKSGW